MIRELHITDDRGVDHPVRTDDLLAGEPWNAARSTDRSAGPRTVSHRTGTHAVVMLLVSTIAFFVVIGFIRAVLGTSFIVSFLLAIPVVALLEHLFSPYDRKLHGMLWRRRLAQPVSANARRQHARLSIARDRACPCCLYSLAEVPADSDGCTSCPECGAAWRMDIWSNDGGIYAPPAVSEDGDGHERGRISAPDARGVVVPLLATRKKIDRQEAIRDCRSRPKRVRLRVSLLAWAVQLLLTGGLAWIVFVLARPEHPLAWIGASVVVILMSMLATIPVGIAYTRQLAIATHPYVIRDMVAENTCPCCESQLRATPSPIDGCLLCDTCGSAWNPPPVPCSSSSKSTPKSAHPNPISRARE